MPGPRAWTGMQVDTFGAGRDLVWVMGWGNRVDSRHERWLVDQLVDAGYRVHAIELPTNTADFARDCVEPVTEYVADLESPALLAHSMGGLALAHVVAHSRVDLDAHAVYLSPWWGMHDLPAIVEPLLALPVSRPFLPISVDPAELGGLATERDATAPNRVAPRWIQTIREHQRSLPPLDDADRVFYTATDAVVDPAAIEAHATPAQRRTYDGGHELFASEGREEYVERVLDALPDPS
jgi:hypothetical protein